jgi:endonuclease/exonuclease/phosphatase family metal-dependent hydrolase
LRFLTYNIRHAEGYDGWVSNKRIAKVIRTSQPDVVGLNEVWSIPRIFEQPRLLGELAAMNWEYIETTRYIVQSLGNAVLTRGSVVGRREIELPRGIERRGALLVDVELDGVAVSFVSTHLSLGRAKRAEQIDVLRRELPRDRPLVIAGDFNCGARELAPLGEFLTIIDEPPLTFPAMRPRRALDHIAFSKHWRLEDLRAVPSLASDHMALLADLALR